MRRLLVRTFVRTARLPKRNRIVAAQPARNFSTNNCPQAPEHNPQLHSYARSYIFERLKYSWATTLGKIFVGVLIALVGWFFNIWTKLYFLYSKATRTKRVAQALEEPSEREVDKKIESGNYVPRPKVEEDLLENIFKLEKTYGLVYGEHGVGKTTVVKKVIKKAREQGYPVFYFPVEEQEGSSFIESFSVALKGFDIIPRNTSLSTEYLVKDFLGLGSQTPASISDLFPTIVKAAKLLLEKTKKRPIIIIDACNNLDINTLIKLQNFAKEQADKSEALVIFVSSEGAAPDILFTRSAASRMNYYKVGELSRQEADHFLEVNYGIKDKTFRSQILDVTGYSFQYLNIESKTNIESIETYVSASIRGYLKAVDMESWNTDDSMVSIIKKILDEDKISLLEFKNIIGNREIAEKILKGNIFSVTPSYDVVSFQNIATRNYFRNKLGLIH